MMTPINNETVNKLIDRYGYYFYVINCIPGTECKCFNHITYSADPKCKKCLGTGHKIRIRKVFGAIRELKERESEAVRSVNATPKIVYVKGKLPISKDDLLVDNEDVFHVLAHQYHKGEKGEYAFTRLVCPYTKTSPAHLIRNLKEIINDNLRKKGD